MTHVPVLPHCSPCTHLPDAFLPHLCSSQSS
jgi:hypothetical protein